MLEFLAVAMSVLLSVHGGIAIEQVLTPTHEMVEVQSITDSVDCAHIDSENDEVVISERPTEVFEPTSKELAFLEEPFSGEEECSEPVSEIEEKEDALEGAADEPSTIIVAEKEEPTTEKTLNAIFEQTTAPEIKEEPTTVEKTTTTTTVDEDNERFYYPFATTNYGASTFERVLAGTNLEGLGECLVKLEQEYGVNGMFCLGVARAESGMGSSYIAKNKNNLFGIMGSSGARSYSSKEECIMAFGRLMTSSTYYGKTIEQIAPIYCNYSWASFVRNCMDVNYDKLR